MPTGGGGGGGHRHPLLPCYPETPGPSTGHDGQEVGGTGPRHVSPRAVPVGCRYVGCQTAGGGGGGERASSPCSQRAPTAGSRSPVGLDPPPPPSPPPVAFSGGKELSTNLCKGSKLTAPGFTQPSSSSSSSSPRLATGRCTPRGDCHGLGAPRTPLPDPGHPAPPEHPELSPGPPFWGGWGGGVRRKHPLPPPPPKGTKPRIGGEEEEEGGVTGSLPGRKKKKGGARRDVTPGRP